MKYKIGTRIDFIKDGESESDFHEYWDIVAYAVMKDAQAVYLVWDNYNEYGNQYDFITENELSEAIKDNEDCGYIVKIREEE